MANERIHDVDGISFVVVGKKVEGAGWDGRYLKFYTGDEQLMQCLMTPELAKGSIRVKVPGRRSVRFDIKGDHWLVGKDSTGRRSFQFAFVDRPALYHVLGELKQLQINKDDMAGHFCPQYGVMDDD